MQNNCTFIGRLTREWENGVTRNGAPYIRNSLAVTAPSVDAMGKHNSFFVDFDIYGKMCEVLPKYTTRGRQILLSGELDVQKWVDQQGYQRTTLRIVNAQCGFVADGNPQQNTAPQPTNTAAQSYTQPQRQNTAPQPQNSYNRAPQAQPQPQNSQFDKAAHNQNFQNGFNSTFTQVPPTNRRQMEAQATAQDNAGSGDDRVPF